MKAGLGVSQVNDELNALATRIAQRTPETNKGVQLTAKPVNQQFNGRITDAVWIAFISVGGPQRQHGSCGEQPVLDQQSRGKRQVLNDVVDPAGTARVATRLLHLIEAAELEARTPAGLGLRQALPQVVLGQPLDVITQFGIELPSSLGPWRRCVHQLISHLPAPPAESARSLPTIAPSWPFRISGGCDLLR